MSENLRGIVSDLQAKLDRMQSTIPQVEGSTAPAIPVKIPYWDCTYQNGATMTTGVSLDWDLLFEDPNATDYMKYRLAAGFGSFDKGNLGYAMQRRWVIMWDSPHPGEVKCLLSGVDVANNDVDANIQVKMNGVVTEYVAGSGPAPSVGQTLTLTVVQGRNRLAISADINPYTVQFCGLLFEDPSHWVDPKTLPNYRY